MEGIIMYGPNLSEFGSVSVRRLAWAIGTNMAEAIDFMALYLPQKMDMSFVCSHCKDKSKCGACGFLKTTNSALITTVK
ncbi:MAG: hypothetical protein LBC60_03550 [Spirochaetaceae bacterium]|nr:hypothetical protein [Spirochaetaceae bacterium]